MRLTAILAALFGFALAVAVAADGGQAPAKKQAQAGKKDAPAAKEAADDDLDDLQLRPAAKDKGPKADRVPPKKTEPPKKDADDEDQKLKKLLDEAGKVGEPEGPAAKEGGLPGKDKAEEILARVAKNMEAAEDRLKNQDPGEKTRKIQEDIVKDLDELLKQQQQQQQSSGSGSKVSKVSKSGRSGSQSGKSGGQSSKGGAQTTKNQGSKSGTGQQGNKGGDKTAKEQKGGTGKKDNEQQAKGGPKGAGNGGGGGNDERKDKNAADLDMFRDAWGHLPQAQRLEMDAYSRERFLPRYDELLRQYYRSIAEQNRRKGE